MKYDFTVIMNRSGKDAVAIDGLGQPGSAPTPPKDGFDFIPMWVADMNFPTVPTIPEAIIARAKHPAYGYFDISDDYYNAIIQWQKTRNGVTGLSKEQIGYENGVLGGVISALTSCAAPGDAILLQPCLYRFYRMHVPERVSHRSQRIKKRCPGHLSYGLCRYGRKNQNAKDPHSRLLLAA